MFYCVCICICRTDLNEGRHSHDFVLYIFNLKKFTLTLYLFIRFILVVDYFFRFRPPSLHCPLDRSIRCAAFYIIFIPPMLHPFPTMQPNFEKKMTRQQQKSRRRRIKRAGLSNRSKRQSLREPLG